MKEKRKKLYIFLGVLLTIIVILGFLYSFGLLQSILFQAQQIDCSNNNEYSWSCSTTNHGSPYIPTIVGNTFTLDINEPTKMATYFSMICSKMDVLSGITCDSDIPEIALHPNIANSDKYAWESYYFINQIGKQLISINASYNLDGENLYFTFYGLCNLGQDQTCEITTPEGVERLPTWDARVNPSSIIISFKKGGYTNEDINNLIEEDRLNSIKSFYRFQDNQCNLINIQLSQKTNNDYETLSECEEKMISISEENNDEIVETQEKSNFSKFIDTILNFFKSLFGLK